tara:strand:+ start:1290 stop:5867 length:4578 start_codon:yes stop_codon:yes gene_type:complete
MAQFKRFQTPALDAELNQTLPDLVLGDKAEATVGGRHTLSSYYVNFKVSNAPEFGSGNLDSLELQTNIGSITFGTNEKIPKLNAFLMYKEATTEGAAKNAAADDSTVDPNYLVYSYTPDTYQTALAETFSNVTLEDKATLVLPDFIKEEHIEPYAPFTAIHSGELGVLNYTVDEVKKYGVRVSTLNGDFLGYKVELTPNWNERAKGETAKTVGQASGYSNYSHGYFIVCKEEYAAYGGAHPPRGKMWLSRTFSSENEIAYNRIKTTNVDSQVLKGASASDTTIFNRFESTPELIINPSKDTATAVTGDVIESSSTDNVESFLATIELDGAKVSTGGNSLKLRTYAKPYANHTFAFSDANGLANRQYVRMDALDIPAPVVYDASASDASSVQSRVMRIRTSIEQMAPAFKSFIGAPDTEYKAKISAITAHDSSTNGLVGVTINLDHADANFGNDDNFFTDRNQHLIGTRASALDGDGNVRSFFVVGFGAYDNSSRTQILLLKRIVHAVNPASDAVLTFHKSADVNENLGQITNQRGLFFNLTTEDIGRGLSHTSAMQLHGRRQNNATDPTGYTVPDSAYDFGIIKDEEINDDSEASTGARYTLVHNGRLFEHGGNTMTGANTSPAGTGELMVDYGPKTGAFFNTTTGTGFSTIATNATGGASAAPATNRLSIKEGEFFDIILVTSPHTSEIKIYVQDLDGNNLFTNSSTRFRTLFNVNAAVTTGFKDPTAASAKWPMNMYIYLNNAKDQRNNTTDATSLESPYWKDFESGDSAVQVESIVNIDSISLEHWKPITSNNTIHLNNTSKAPISFAHTGLPDYKDTGRFDNTLTFQPKSYIAIGHKTATSVSGDDSQLSLLFTGFNRPSAGLDNNQSLTKITTSTFGATTTEKQGHQGRFEFFDTSSGTGYAASGFDIDGHALGPDGFTCKGAAVLKWDDSPRTHTKRECIFASARVTKIIDDKTVIVDNPDMLRVDFGESSDWDQTFIMYKYGEDFDDANHKQGLKIESIIGNIVKFTTTIKNDDGGASEFNDNNLFNVYVSPEAFWIVVGFDVDGKESRSYSGLARVPSHTSNDTPDFTLGVTFNESLYNDGANTNAWNLIVGEDTNINVAHDYGFGTFKDNQTGFASTLWANVGANNFTFNESVVSQNNYKLGDTIPMLIQPNTFTDAVMSLDTKDNATAADRPRCVTVFEDELPTVSSFKVSPNESDPFNLDFTWECSDEDIWYGFISLDSKSIENQYTNALLHFPLNEAGAHGNSAFSTEPIENISGASTEANGILYDLEGLAGNAVRFDGTNDYVRTASGQAALGDLTEASFVIHTVHDTAAISGTQHILFKDECVEISANSSSQIVCDLYWDANSFVRLTSTSLIIRDGATPQNIIVTLDTTLKSGNAKLFIDGRLEDQSGLAISADENGEQTGWLKDATLENNSNKLFIGSNAATSGNGWVGKIEEVVVYSKALYPVKPSDGKFTLTKPLKELHSTQNSSSLAYTARIFVKDYHNIRGKSRQEVASSPAISFRKAAFLLNNS